jgi:hypothetical protein
MNLLHAKLLCATACAVGALLLAGCPGRNTTKKPPEPCRELGQQCEFAPGKLGACSYRANCTGAGCLYCQSQH